jgi:protein-disulfide isomerase
MLAFIEMERCRELRLSDAREYDEALAWSSAFRTAMRRLRHFGAWLLLGAMAVYPAPLGAEDAALATLENRSITAADMQAGLAIPLYELEMEKYRLLRRRLEQTIAEELLKRAAAAAGQSVSAYVTEQIQEQLGMVTDAEVETRYRQARAQASAGQPDAFSVPEDQGLRQQIKGQLLREQASKGLQALLTRLSAEAKVTIHLRPPEPPVAVLQNGDDPALGPPAAAVTVVEFADFECPICKESLPVLEKLRQLYPEQVRFVYRDLPLASHPEARSAAEAAQCAYEQGQFWIYHDALFALAPDLNSSQYPRVAARLGLDTAKFEDCMKSGRSKAAVARDLAEAQRLGLGGTPTFFINGRYMGGFQTLDALREAVDRELQVKNSSQPKPEAMK